MLSITTRVGVLALGGVLALAARSSAAPVTFDVAGHATISTAAAPAPPPGYFVSIAIAPSAVTVDVAGDGAVTLTGATLSWEMFASFGAIGSITTDEVLSLPSGDLGTLVGDQIVWSSDLVYGSLTGTFHCEGPICEVIGVPPIVIQPLSALEVQSSAFFPTTEGFALGTWALNDDHTRILASTRMVLARFQSGAQLGEPARWLVLGDAVLPEPAGAVLILAGLVAIAARQRVATAR